MSRIRTGSSSIKNSWAAPMMSSRLTVVLEQITRRWIMKNMKDFVLKHRVKIMRQITSSKSKERQRRQMKRAATTAAATKTRIEAQPRARSTIYFKNTISRKVANTRTTASAALRTVPKTQNRRLRR